LQIALDGGAAATAVLAEAAIKVHRGGQT